MSKKISKTETMIEQINILNEAWEDVKKAARDAIKEKVQNRLKIIFKLK